MLTIFYSGEENLATPEKVLGKEANVMLTYWAMQKRPNKRMRTIIKSRLRLHLVPGYDGFYAVKMNGTVWSCRARSGGPVLNKRRTWKNKWREMKQSTTSSGYRYVTIRKKGRPVKRTVHTLMLLTFAGPPPTGMESRHFPDDNKSNNAIDNLSYATKSQNQRDRNYHGTHSGKLDAGRVKEMRHLRMLDPKRWTWVALGNKFGVSSQAAVAICKNKVWK